MPLQVLQRPDWHGTPLELGDLFRLKKNRRETRAASFTHQLGWKLRTKGINPWSSTVTGETSHGSGTHE